MQATETDGNRESYDRHAGRQPASLSIDGNLLRQAHDLGIDLAATLEAALAAQIERRRRESWREENREAIAACNEAVLRHGLWSDDLRSF
jgi:antitoxin CcdA